MDINSLTSRFVLSPLSAPKSKFSKLFTPAAVLFPIVERDQQLNLILTRRASHLRHHSGQIALPGGKTEKTDSS